MRLNIDGWRLAKNLSQRSVPTPHSLDVGQCVQRNCERCDGFARYATCGPASAFLQRLISRTLASATGPTGFFLSLSSKNTKPSNNKREKKNKRKNIEPNNVKTDNVVFVIFVTSMSTFNQVRYTSILK